jgi:hypothetical protein
VRETVNEVTKELEVVCLWIELYANLGILQVCLLDLNIQRLRASESVTRDILVQQY